MQKITEDEDIKNIDHSMIDGNDDKNWRRLLKRDFMQYVDFFHFYPSPKKSYQLLDDLRCLSNFFCLDMNLKDVYNLKELIHNSNSIQYIPKEIYRMDNLRVLDLTSNQIKEIPKQIIKLFSLSKLKLSDNQIEEMPDIFEKNFVIRDIRLDYNKIKEINIKKLSGVNHLDLRRNEIKKIKIENCCLTFLDLRYNKLEEFNVHPTSLEYLYLNHNNLSKIPKTLFYGGLGIVVLDLSNNNISKLSKKIGNIWSIKELNISKNNIKILPKELARLKNLESLILDAGIETDWLLKELPQLIVN